MKSQSILVLHSECTGGSSTQQQHDDQHAFAWKQLQESTPLICDFVLIPEIPATLSQADTPIVSSFRERRQAAYSQQEKQMTKLEAVQLHPCGLDNLLLFEDLPDSSNFLASLSNCRFQVGLLPVEAVPSTFNLQFEPQNDFVYMGDHNADPPVSSGFAQVEIQLDVDLAQQMFQEQQQPVEELTSNEELQEQLEETQRTMQQESLALVCPKNTTLEVSTQVQLHAGTPMTNDHHQQNSSSAGALVGFLPASGDKNSSKVVVEDFDFLDKNETMSESNDKSTHDPLLENDYTCDRFGRTLATLEEILEYQAANQGKNAHCFGPMYIPFVGSGGRKQRRRKWGNGELLVLEQEGKNSTHKILSASVPMLSNGSAAPTVATGGSQQQQALLTSVRISRSKKAAQSLPQSPPGTNHSRRGEMSFLVGRSLRNDHKISVATWESGRHKPNHSGVLIGEQESEVTSNQTSVLLQGRNRNHSSDPIEESQYTVLKSELSREELDQNQTSVPRRMAVTLPRTWKMTTGAPKPPILVAKKRRTAKSIPPTSSSSQRSEQELLLIQELQESAQREEQMINRILMGLAGMGILLIVAFLWTFQQVRRKMRIQQLMAQHYQEAAARKKKSIEKSQSVATSALSVAQKKPSIDNSSTHSSPKRVATEKPYNPRCSPTSLMNHRSKNKAYALLHPPSSASQTTEVRRPITISRPMMHPEAKARKQEGCPPITSLPSSSSVATLPLDTGNNKLSAVAEKAATKASAYSAILGTSKSNKASAHNNSMKAKGNFKDLILTANKNHSDKSAKAVNINASKVHADYNVSTSTINTPIVAAATKSAAASSGSSSFSEQLQAARLQKAKRKSSAASKPKATPGPEQPGPPRLSSLSDITARACEGKQPGPALPEEKPATGAAMKEQESKLPATVIHSAATETGATKEVELSPCSRLAKQWEETKSLRRSKKGGKSTQRLVVPELPTLPSQHSMKKVEAGANKATASAVDPIQMVSPQSNAAKQAARRLKEKKSLYISPEKENTNENLVPSPAPITPSSEGSFLDDYW